MVSILQRQSVIRSLRKLDALLVVSVTLLFTAAPLIPRNAAIGAASGTAVLAVLAWYKRCRAAAPFSTFCVICLGLALSGVPYFQVVLALGLLCYAGVVRGVPWLRGTATWARWGSFDATVGFLCVAAWLLAAAALLSWYLLLHPNIADIVEAFVPALPFGRLWFGEPDAIDNAISYAKFFSRSHDAVIRVYDDAGNVIDTHEQAGDFKE